MSIFRAFLRLGELPDGTMEGMLRGGYELAYCDFSFSQAIDQKGETQSEVIGEPIELTLLQLPTDEILEWGLNSRRYIPAAIVLYDPDGYPVEKIFLKTAACISFKMHYTREGKSYFATKLTLLAKTIVLGREKLEKNWTI